MDRLMTCEGVAHSTKIWSFSVPPLGQCTVLICLAYIWPNHVILDCQTMSLDERLRQWNKSKRGTRLPYDLKVTMWDFCGSKSRQNPDISSQTDSQVSFQSCPLEVTSITQKTIVDDSGDENEEESTIREAIHNIKLRNSLRAVWNSKIKPSQPEEIIIQMLQSHERSIRSQRRRLGADKVVTANFRL